VSHHRLRTCLRRFALLGCAAAALTAAGGARAALIEFDNLALRADGSFEPRSLPRRGYEPISFMGHVDIRSRDGSRPTALRQAIIGFDRDGRLDTTGLPVCAPERIAQAGVAEARSICKAAMVGSGRVEADVSLATGTVPVSSPLTLFNGPPQNGQPTVIAHAQTTVPATQTYAIVIPIERRRGEFRYRATIDLPPIAGGLGSITRIEAKINRRFRSGGKQRSYVSARCTDGILRTSGYFAFEDGDIVEGAVEKFCHAR
jgi:hypothetical protein